MKIKDFPNLNYCIEITLALLFKGCGATLCHNVATCIAGTSLYFLHNWLTVSNIMMGISTSTSMNINVLDTRKCSQDKRILRLLLD